LFVASISFLKLSDETSNFSYVITAQYIAFAIKPGAKKKVTENFREIRVF
jgi:hypothetical protein